ncbi:hypothetical protein PI126_g19385 [Phytophthora idaei]|nr:hypothetical protein PI126_g19385 [Phytophthora idaei]
MRTKNLLLSCALDDGSLCYRQRFLLRKLLVNKWWSQVACSFNVWRAFCSDSSAVLARLLAVDQRQRQRCALLRWRRMVRCQQLGEQAEATVIVRHSHQAAKILARMIAKHEKLLLISLIVETATDQESALSQAVDALKKCCNSCFFESISGAAGASGEVGSLAAGLLASQDDFSTFGGDSKESTRTSSKDSEAIQECQVNKNHNAKDAATGVAVDRMMF